MTTTQQTTCRIPWCQFDDREDTTCVHAANVGDHGVQINAFEHDGVLDPPRVYVPVVEFSVEDDVTPEFAEQFAADLAQAAALARHGHASLILAALGSTDPGQGCVPWCENGPGCDGVFCYKIGSATPMGRDLTAQVGLSRYEGALEVHLRVGDKEESGAVDEQFYCTADQALRIGQALIAAAEELTTFG